MFFTLAESSLFIIDSLSKNSSTVLYQQPDHVDIIARRSTVKWSPQHITVTTFSIYLLVISKQRSPWQQPQTLSICLSPSDKQLPNMTEFWGPILKTS